MSLSEKRKAQMKEYAKARRAKQTQDKAFNPKGEEARLKQMREYAQIRRAIAKAATKEQREMHELAKLERKERMKAERKEISIERANNRKLRKNEKKRTEYLAAKGGVLDYGKTARALKAKPKAIKPPKLRKMKAAPVPKPKHNQLPNRIIDLSKCVPLKLDAKTTVFIRPDQDPELVRQKFLARKI